MSGRELRLELDEHLGTARARYLGQAYVTWLTRISPFTFLGGAKAILIARASEAPPMPLVAVSLAVFALTLVLPLLVALVTAGTLFATARRIDKAAGLKDLLASALHFSRQDSLDEAEHLLVTRAVAHAGALNFESLIPVRKTPMVRRLGILAIALAASLVVPVGQPEEPVDAAVMAKRALQDQDLQALADEFEETFGEDEELADLRRQMTRLQERFANAEADEKEVLLELSRLEEQLRARVNESNLAQLNHEIGVMTPHLVSNGSTASAGAALRDENLEKAAEEMERLAERVEKDEISPEDREKMAQMMGVTAAKLGKGSGDSFAGDFKTGEGALKNGNGKGFKSAAKSISDRLRRAQKFRKWASMCSSLGNCRSGFCQSPGSMLALLRMSNKKGGLKAGSGTAGSPFGEQNRLNAGYRELLNVSGLAGDGPVNSEIEIIEGQASESSLGARDIFTEYNEVAEEALSREDVPLSRRVHVKRYFQSIRPDEEGERAADETP